MEKINKKIIDEENNTITIVMDKKTYENKESEEQKRKYERGFNDALFELKYFMQHSNSIDDLKPKAFIESVNKEKISINRFSFISVVAEFNNLFKKKHETKEEEVDASDIADICSMEAKGE